MASLKTSQETSGYPLQKNDLHRIARSGNNHKVNSEELFSEVLTYTQFETKRTAGNLIAGRWYKVSECGYDLNQTILVLADTNISWNPRIKWLTAPNDTVECDAIELNQDFVRYYDSQGNDYGGYGNFCAEFPPIGKGVTWSNTKIDNIANCCFTNANSGVVSNSYFNNVSLDFQNVTIEVSNIDSLNDGGYQSQVPILIRNCDIHNLYYVTSNKTGGTITIQSSNLHNVEIYFNGDFPVTLSNLKLKDCILYITDEVYLSNSSFNNATVELFGGQVSVENLQIFGKGIPHTQYKIDGAFQSRILNSWAGTVVADTTYETLNHRTGFSTVKMYVNVTDDFSGDPGIYDVPSGTMYLPESTPVGIFIINEIGEAGSLYYIGTASDDISHQIEICLRQYNPLQLLDINFETLEDNASSSATIISYHGKTNKVGILQSTNDFVRLKYQYNQIVGQMNWYLIYGVHYDANVSPA